MRPRIAAAAAAVLLAGPCVLAFFTGGFFERERLIAALVAWALVAVAAVVSPTPLPRGGPARLALLGLVLLTLWTGLSYDWAPLGERAQGDLERLLGYVAMLVAALALLRARPVRRWTEPALALGVFVVIGYGLSERLLPGAVHFQRSLSARGRLEQPLTYWNATGCLAAIGLVLCLRLAADGRRPAWLRGAAGFAGVPLGAAVFLTYSRGALLAVIVGAGALLVLAPAARAQIRALLSVGLPAIAASAVAALLPTVSSLPRGTHGDAGQGAIMLAVLILLSGAAAWLVARSSPAATAPPHAGRWRTVTLVAGLVTVVVAATGIAAAQENNPGIPKRSATSAKRLGSTDSLRYSYWRVALRGFRRHPLKGVGSGGFAVDWQRQRNRPEAAVDAHSLYVETASELGLVGLAVLALLFASVAAGTHRLQRIDPAAAAGPAAALLAWAVHAGLDWDWELPALSGIAVILTGAVLAWSEEDSGPRYRDGADTDELEAVPAA